MGTFIDGTEASGPAAEAAQAPGTGRPSIWQRRFSPLYLIGVLAIIFCVNLALSGPRDRPVRLDTLLEDPGGAGIELRLIGPGAAEPVVTAIPLPRDGPAFERVRQFLEGGNLKWRLSGRGSKTPLDTEYAHINIVTPTCTMSLIPGMMHVRYPDGRVANAMTMRHVYERLEELIQAGGVPAASHK